ncbi:argininosuccinate lyase [Rossellomorea marisflavi]|uniref:Argininosuccinate lyase n=1 Tax=Rossellomorea marisflavi TaxID=189381 RepID=A0A5D4S4I6_9BACI|nr:argininosuccinate lyase [Rossellomorea marisflavi]MDW4527658.1 argininosuccinate lyase [Rossellomorea marisflavi]TYS57088.1 argininosuccinate lyase [Rossellomorea marisflavi]UKS64309.1 argininosuccinate lyase [Rossellomorea marisflavi]
MMKLWGGRFTKKPEEWVDEFNASISFDQELVMEDIEGSKAHVTMLKKCGILSAEEADQILGGLNELEEKAAAGSLEFSTQYEDIHLNLEKLLIDTVGEVGGKLHTGRSRNDQIATDMHLFLKKRVEEVIGLIGEFQEAILKQAEDNIETMIPGYTHLQRAQPISFAHHLMTYYWMLDRDKERLSDSMKRIDLSPLGAGALAGTTFPIDRAYSAELLGFSGVYENSLDAVSDRDFILEFLSNSAILMTHLSRLAEEFILWSTEEFHFIELDDSFTTGSSIMPQKKNPDMAELVRGKTGRVNGNLLSLLTVLKGLPLAYNKDMQEDKEGMFDTVKTVIGSLKIFTGMMDTMTVNKDVMEEAVGTDFSNATELADYLAAKGMPFRKAHEVVGKLVLHCIEQGYFLKDVTLATYQQHSELIESDIYDIIAPSAAVKRRNSYGGTGFEQVKIQIEKAKGALVTK